MLYADAPKTLFDRPKTGFAIRIGEWLRGNLRDWAEDLLSPTSLSNGGFFDPAVVRARWADHLSGRRDSH